VAHKYDWRPPQRGDSRSPCPALNVLANHGHLPRDGKNISHLDFARGLRTGYNLSRPLAYFLAFGAPLLLGRFGRVNLADLAQHNKIEHDASLAHADAPAGAQYAPTEPDAALVAKVCQEVRRGEDGLMDAEDMARSRVRREKECRPLDGLHAEVARGEMALVLGIFGVREGGTVGVPVRWFKEWVLDERFPAEWKSSGRVTGIWEMLRNSTVIRHAMKRFRKAD